MDLNTEWSVFLAAILGSLVTVVPVAVGLLKTYIEVKQNRLRINNRPTHDQVAVAIDAKAKELLANGNGAENDHNWRNHRAGDSYPPRNA